MSPKNPLQNLLNLALSMSSRHFEYYDETADSVETPQVQALLRVLADTERDLIAQIRHMMATGVLDEIEAMGKVEVSERPPNDTPFAPDRNDTAGFGRSRSLPGFCRFQHTPQRRGTCSNQCFCTGSPDRIDRPYPAAYPVVLSDHQYDKHVLQSDHQG